MPIHYLFFLTTLVVYAITSVVKADERPPRRRVEVVVPQHLLDERLHVVVRLSPDAEATLYPPAEDSVGALVSFAGGALLPIMGTEPVPFGRVNIGLRMDPAEFSFWAWAIPDIQPYTGICTEYQQPMYGGGLHVSLRAEIGHNVHFFTGVGPQAQLLAVSNTQDPFSVGVSVVSGFEWTYPISNEQAVAVGFGGNLVHSLFRQEEFPAELETLLNVFAHLSFRL